MRVSEENVKNFNGHGFSGTTARSRIIAPSDEPITDRQDTNRSVDLRGLRRLHIN
jgi:hypothetical protein